MEKLVVFRSIWLSKVWFFSDDGIRQDVACIDQARTYALHYNYPGITIRYV